MDEKCKEVTILSKITVTITIDSTPDSTIYIDGELAGEK